MEPVRSLSREFSTDEMLLKAYQASGDQSDLATLYMRYTDLVYGVALKYLSEREAAKDAVMSIYQELVPKLKTHAVGNFKSWLYVVTKNHCLMKLRKEKKAVVLEFQADHMQSEDFTHLDSILEKENEFRLLERCIEKLNKEQQSAIRLFYMEGKCYNEIVEITGLPWDKIRSVIQNARRNLKICMEKNAGK